MVYSYRITKYNSIRGGKHLSSSLTEWTSYYDIGSKVTEDDYLLIENAYIDTVINLCTCLNIKKLKITELEINDPGIQLLNNKLVSLDQLKNILQMILREHIWCKLKSNKCEFHFGYDYYMYFISKNNPQDCLVKINNKLNVQEIRSPYLA